MSFVAAAQIKVKQFENFFYSSGDFRKFSFLLRRSSACWRRFDSPWGFVDAQFAQQNFVMLTNETFNNFQIVLALGNFPNLYIRNCRSLMLFPSQNIFLETIFHGFSDFLSFQVSYQNNFPRSSDCSRHTEVVFADSF